MTQHGTRMRRGLLLLGWVLVYARHGNDWRAINEFAYSAHCEQARAAEVDRETQAAIGGALAGQPADNPIRREAYERAARHVEDRYRCAETR